MFQRGLQAKKRGNKSACVYKLYNLHAVCNFFFPKDITHYTSTPEST